MSFTRLRCDSLLMVFTSATNSFSPRFELLLLLLLLPAAVLVVDTRFTATSMFILGRYTVPKPPLPSLRSGLKLAVALRSSLSLNLIGPRASIIFSRLR
nr:unnamed protein product [Digitaria exilis]